MSETETLPEVAPEPAIKPKVRVMIATPMRHFPGLNGLHLKHQALVDDLARLSNDPACPYEFQLAFIEGGQIRGRNKICAAFLKSPCRWLGWQDDDVEMSGSDWIQLLSHRRPVVGALYCRRSEPPVWVANFMYECKIDPKGLLQVHELGMGAKLYHREVFENIIRMYPDQMTGLEYQCRDTGAKEWGFFQIRTINRDMPPEDYFLDLLCAQCKIAVWADTNLKVKHRAPDGTLYPSAWPALPCGSE